MRSLDAAPAPAETRNGLPHPRVFIATGLAFAAFLLSALALSALTGAPFTAPTENVSRAIGVSYIVPFAIGITGYLAVQFAAHFRAPGVLSLRTRLRNVMADSYFLILFVAVIYLHFHIKMWMPLVNPALYDDFYYALDNQARGLIDGMTALRNAIAGSEPRADYLYQVGFLLMFAVSLWGHALGSRRWHFHNMTAILLMEMAGALTYLIAPAIGPFIFEAGPNASATQAQGLMLEAFRAVQEQGAAWLAVHGGDYFTGPPAAMPSLHIAGAIIIAYYMVRARSVLAPFMVLMALWIGLESVVSRWHYLIDLPPGIALAALAIFLTNHLCLAQETQGASGAGAGTTGAF